MPINRELHKENLKALVAEYGGNKPLAAAINLGINAPDKPLEDNQISNALRDHRPFGEKIMSGKRVGRYNNCRYRPD